MDYEIKRDLYADLARTWQDKSKCPETVKEAVARRHGLRVVNEEIQIPDMRLEYANDPDMEIHARDVELATEHYRQFILEHVQNTLTASIEPEPQLG